MRNRMRKPLADGQKPVKALARECGVSRQSIWDWRKQGCSDAEIRERARRLGEIQQLRRDPNPRVAAVPVVPAASTADQSASPAVEPAKTSGDDAGVNPGVNPGDVPPYTVSQARRAHAEAQLRELAIQEKKGELVQLKFIGPLLVDVFTWLVTERRHVAGRLKDEWSNRSAVEFVELLDSELRRHEAEIERRLRQGPLKETMDEFAEFRQWREEKRRAD